MFRVLKNMAVVVVALLSLTGCFKEVTTATTLCIKVMEEVPVMMEEMGELTEVSKGLLPAKECYAYLYYNTSKRDTILSYEDAAARIITNLDTGEKRSIPDVESEVYAIEGSTWNYLSLYQQKREAFVVVVYPAARMYAYMSRLSEAENLPQTYLSLIFHTWKSGAYKEGSKEGYKWDVFAPETPVRPPVVIEKPINPSKPEKPIVPDMPTEPETPEGDESESGGIDESTNN